MSDRLDRSSTLGWGRAAVIAVVIAIIALALLVYVPNALITRWTALIHSARVAITVTYFFAALFAVAGALRMLQHRGVL